MSFAHFDEMYEIILGLMEEEEALLNVGAPNDWMENLPNGHHWWEEAVTEIKAEKEKEELYV